MAKQTEPHFHPSISLLSRLGSIVVHADEMLSSNGHEVDKIALQNLLNDPEVKRWIKEMGPLLPLKRTKQ